MAAMFPRRMQRFHGLDCPHSLPGTVREVQAWWIEINDLGKIPEAELPSGAIAGENRL